MYMYMYVCILGIPIEKKLLSTIKKNTKTTTMSRVILRMTMGRMRMGQGAGVMGQPHTPNGDSLTVFTSQQEQGRGWSPRRTVV